MDWKIILAGLAASIAILTIAFRQRQLYLIIPKMFEYSALSTKGRVVELTLLNRGWLMEEEIRLEMPPGLHIELVASDTAGVRKPDEGVFSIGRLPQRSSAQLLLLVEGEVSTTEFQPKLTSKTSKGNLTSIFPMNIGNWSLVCVCCFWFVGFAVNQSAKTQREIERIERETAKLKIKYEEARTNEVMQMEKLVATSLELHQNVEKYCLPARTQSANE